jgi:hypothetical protein
MTKNDFIVRQKTLKRYALKISLVHLAVLALFMLWPQKKGLHGTDPVFAICLIACLFGGIVLNIWLQIRKQKQPGYCCPKCGKRFGKNAAKIVLATGKCGRYGETIITE